MTELKHYRPLPRSLYFDQHDETIPWPRLIAAGIVIIALFLGFGLINQWQTGTNQLRATPNGTMPR